VSIILGMFDISSLNCVAHLARLIADESGQDMIEYALIAATIGLGTVAGIDGIAQSISRYMFMVGVGFDNAIHHH
jgi:pilus assembly protein Flp/PilA